jgi:PPIC-type PPIASE domain
LAGLAVGICQAQQPAGSSPAAASDGAASSPATSTPPPTERVVIKVGDRQITQADFETYIRDLEAQQGPATLPRRTLGDNYASMLMLAQQALAHHLDSSPEVIRQLAIDRNQILSNAEFDRLKRQATPSPEEISQYYSAHLADYDVVQLRRVFIWKKSEKVKDGVSPQEAEALAAAIRKAYASGTDPKKLIHAPKDVVLDAQPLEFQRGEVPETMEKVAFTLKQGEWTVLEDSPTTLALLQVVKRSRRDLKDVSASIEKKLQAQKLRAELNDLKAKTGVWMDQAYFPPAAGQTHSSNPQSKTSAPTTSVPERGKNEDERQR